MKYCTKMGLCAWRSLLNGRASCVSTEPCELAVAPENDAQQLKAEILPLLTDALDEFADRKFDNGSYYLKQAMAKLSAV